MLQELESLRGALLFQSMPDLWTQIVPLFAVAAVLTLWAVLELGNSIEVSAWDAR